jgi:hypothetical protein
LRDLRRCTNPVPDLGIRCFSRSRPFPDVSRSFAGRMRDECGTNEPPVQLDLSVVVGRPDRRQTVDRGAHVPKAVKDYLDTSNRSAILWVDHGAPTRSPGQSRASSARVRQQDARNSGVSDDRCVDTCRPRPLQDGIQPNGRARVPPPPDVSISRELAVSRRRRGCRYRTVRDDSTTCSTVQPCMRVRETVHVFSGIVRRARSTFVASLSSISGR